MKEETYTSKRALPKNYDARDRPFFDREFSKTIFPYTYRRFKYFILDYKGRILNTSGLTNSRDLEGVKGVLVFLIRVVKGKFGIKPSRDYIVPFDGWSGGYFHWVCDVLPKVFLARKQGKKLFILPHQNSFQKESIEIFDDINVNFIKTGESFFVKQGYLLETKTTTGNYDEKLMNEMRSQILEKIPFHESSRKRLFISRQKSKRRLLTNECDVVDLLTKFGFEKIYLEEFTFYEQVNMMRQAEIIVGMHGAGLTNLMFMEKDSHVLEFRPENDKTNLCYFSLASAVKINYWYQFVCLKDIKSQAYEVDINELKTTMQTLLKNIKVDV